MPQETLPKRWNRYLIENEEKKWVRRLLFFQRDDSVCFYPEFESKEELTDHWFRSSWYLPKQEPFLRKVWFASQISMAAPTEEDRPSYISEEAKELSHLSLVKGKLGMLWKTIRSKHIAVWKKDRRKDRFVSFLRLLGKRISYVAIDDEQGREYAHYCELNWWVLSPPKRRAVCHQSKLRFIAHVEELKKTGLKKAYVFGNGPSLETSFDYDFSDGFRIMCNSVVNNIPLLDHVKPHFVVAGDPVNHFGCSTYAAKYRENLWKALDERPDMYLVVPDFHGYPLIANFPQYEERMFIIPMKAKVVNFDLTREYRIPMFWSVLNALMIPVACTLSDEIYTLGCDGMSRDRDNEDFWAHAKGVIDEKITDAHRCHPTFDMHRKSHPEYVRVQLDLAQNVIRAENEHNKRFHAINHSHMALLDGRHVELDDRRVNPAIT
ncbi:MAG: hypothetical protein H6752_05355 [Candidatus Omnitrophica bacterium]|nr:hypothetical protein [Candidatus Omnitrophota bacterium]